MLEILKKSAVSLLRKGQLDVESLKHAIDKAYEIGKKRKERIKSE